MERPILELAALKLPAGDRALLADRLLSSLDNEEADAIEAAWGVEAEARYAVYQKGEIQSADGAAVLKQFRAQYAR